jgi:CRP-like cAMP-binding protein
MEMAESYGRYAVRYWLTELAVDDPTDSDVRACVYSALQRADMSLALPAHALFLTQDTDDRKASKTERKLARRRKLLDSLELFDGLSDDERDALSRELKHVTFARGEVMTRQGDPAHWLYLVEDGQATVRVGDGKLEREVAQLTAPCVFGEMSLLTGEARSATVVAASEVDCFRLEKDAFRRVLATRPELAEQLATLLTRRKVELQAAREGLTADAARERARSEANALLSRIRSFFAAE